MSKQNMALLSQKEIDTLIEFLTEKKRTIPSDVLDQSSIDKLILLIKAMESSKLTLHSLELPDDSLLEGLKSIDTKNDVSVNGLELLFKLNSTTGYVELYAYDDITKKELSISPNNLSELSLTPDNSRWGYAIAPSTFHKVASIFNLNYSSETYTAVCERFALKIYGNTNTDIPDVFLPNKDELLTSISNIK